jgi:hypothetical protein
LGVTFRLTIGRLGLPILFLARSAITTAASISASS